MAALTGAGIALGLGVAMWTRIAIGASRAHPVQTPWWRP